MNFTQDNFNWFYQIGWKTGMEADGKQAGHTDVFFNQFQDEEQEEMVRRGEEIDEKTRWHFHLYEDWIDLFEWQSACYAFSVIKRRELLYVNGKFIQGYKWQPQFKEGWGDYPLTLVLMAGWRGELTDLNIYDHAFDDDEMVSWTTSCKTPPDGKILSWRPEIFNLANNNDTKVIIDEVAADDLCRSKSDSSDILELFYSRASPAQSQEMCARLNGQLNLIPAGPDTDRRGFALTSEFEEFAKKTNRSDLCFWVAGKASINDTAMIEVDDGYQVYQKGGRWVVKDPYTNEILGIPLFLWKTGHAYTQVTEECFACCANYGGSADSTWSDEKFCEKRSKCKNGFNCWSQKCERTDLLWLGEVCSFKQKVKLKLKGLCKESKVDTEYVLLGYEPMLIDIDQKRNYGGSTGWVLSHDMEQDIWKLEHFFYPYLSLTMEEKDSLPVGVHLWLAGNDTCNLGKTSRLVGHNKLLMFRSWSKRTLSFSVSTFN